MVFNTDIATYSVCYRENDVLKTYQCSTFAAAAGTADALHGIVRLINVTFSNKDGTSSISGCLHIYSKDNTRRIANQYLVNQALKRGGR